MPRFSFPFSLAADDILYGLTTQSCAVVVLYPFQPVPWSYVQRCGRYESMLADFRFPFRAFLSTVTFLSSNLKCLRFPFFWRNSYYTGLFLYLSLPLFLSRRLPFFLFFFSAFSPLLLPSSFITWRMFDIIEILCSGFIKYLHIWIIDRNYNRSRVYR